MRILLLPFRLIFSLFRAIFQGILHFFRDIHILLTYEPEDAPLGDAFARTMEDPSGLLEHFNALRVHLLRSVLALLIASSLAFAFHNQILKFLAEPLEGGLSSLVVIDITEPIGTVFRVALLAGLAVAFPYIVLEIWLFVAPGISRQSRFKSLALIPVAFLFFLAGMAFAYFILLPPATYVMITFLQEVEPQIRLSSYLAFTTSVMFWIGLFFEFPLVTGLLASAGIIKAKVLQDQWRLAVVVMAIIAAMVTPTIDFVNMMLVFIPMLVLYILGIAMAYFAQGRRERRLQSQV